MSRVTRTRTPFPPETTEFNFFSKKSKICPFGRRHLLQDCQLMLRDELAYACQLY